MSPEEIFKQCKADIDFIIELKNGRRYQDAQHQLKKLKRDWTEIVRRNKGGEIERRLEKAMGDLPNAKTSPVTWLDLHVAKWDLD